jgi:hypothetical protein
VRVLAREEDGGVVELREAAVEAVLRREQDVAHVGARLVSARAEDRGERGDLRVESVLEVDRAVGRSDSGR